MATEKGKAFDSSNPPLEVTDPGGPHSNNRIPYIEFPLHLHKPDGAYIEVTNAADRDARLAEGWNLKPGPAPEKAKADKAKAA